MKTKYETPQEPFDFSKIVADIIRGGGVGAFAITTVTPIINFTNHVLAKQKIGDLIEQGKAVSDTIPKFTLRRAFDGVLAYNSSVVPMISVSLYTNSVLIYQARQHGIEPSDMMKLCFSTIAGMLAGSVGVLPEGIAQTQQLRTPKPQAQTIVRNVIEHNGFFALTRGMGPTMIRQGIFTAGYMGLMPIFTKQVQEKIPNRFIADLFSAMVCGLIVGPATAPWNMLRFERQRNFDKPGLATPYSAIIHKASIPDSGFKLMAGWKPRTFMSTCSMFLLHKGREIYDQMSSQHQHSPSELKPK